MNDTHEHRRMRILLEPSDYILRNMGDMAMLRTAVTRLVGLWPQAHIQVLSDVPDNLRSFCPEVEPLDTRGRRAWFANGYLIGRHSYRLGNGVQQRLARLENAIRHHWPQPARSLLIERRTAASERSHLQAFLQAVESADLVVANGMGGITDAFPDYARELLQTFNLACRAGATTAMLGQGMGPLNDAGLRRLARQVLPKIDLIGLREEHAGRPLLDALGVNLDRVVTSGDDALEMAYSERSPTLGDGIGINARVANYSGVDGAAITQLRTVLHRAANRLDTTLIPVPISRVPEEADAATIHRLLEGFAAATDDGSELTHPVEVILQIARCRIVVTGSYHAGVFALAQGIPVVGLAATDYYVDKFLGLADQFGAGCTTVRLDRVDAFATLAGSIDDAWQTAEHNRPRLLTAARRQIKQGHGVYQRLQRLTNARSPIGRDAPVLDSANGTPR